MTLSTTAIAKLTSATTRIAVPLRASIRPVAMPAIATTRQTTATRANRTATTRTPSFLARAGAERVRRQHYAPQGNPRRTVVGGMRAVLCLSLAEQPGGVPGVACGLGRGSRRNEARGVLLARLRRAVE